ncbi:MAG: prepilin-type N-terminal cleavage/methylation domain-containing protein [Desulfobacterales bacterium]|nr:prepilin-type N-terminal cleavage/methylation domain-containing protein [Desulfobacterales bacterium]
MNLRARLGNGMGIARNNKGFTLIEMAIVLIIIGIILGAVVKGKDLIRGAEQKKIYSKFINSWRTSYLSFYDRTGKILGDTDDASGGPGQDGEADGATCSELVDGSPASPPEFYGLTQVGLAPPNTNAYTPDKNCKYRYTDSCGGVHKVTVTFDYDDTDEYNYMDITYIPNELAMALDTIIDGEADGQSGDFLHGDGTTYWGTSPCAIATNRGRWKMQF